MKAVASVEAANVTLVNSVPSLVLLDLGLPGMSGQEWLIGFCAMNRETYVVAVSAVADPRVKPVLLIAHARQRQVELDPMRHMVRVGFVGLALSATEFRLLWHLAAYEARWVSEVQLSDAVCWHRDTAPGRQAESSHA